MVLDGFWCPKILEVRPIVQFVVRVHVPLHVPQPLPPTSDASYRCHSTIRTQKSSLGALHTVQSRMAAKDISCAKTGGAAKSRKKHPRNYPPWCVLIKLKSTYCVVIMIPNKLSVSLAPQQLFFKSCPRYHFRGAAKYGIFLRIQTLQLNYAPSLLLQHLMTFTGSITMLVSNLSTIDVHLVDALRRWKMKISSAGFRVTTTVWTR